MNIRDTKILIVDDEEGIRKQLGFALEDNYVVLTAATAGEALTLTREQKPNVVLLDISLSPYSGSQEGLDILPELLEINSLMKVIMVTGNGERANALTAVKNGAFDFYVKPIELDELSIIIKRAAYLQKLELENARLNESLQDLRGFSNIIG
ncbi:MAG: response regulator, partial [Candidatus Zixiibacteriota bacterium]